VGEDVEQDEWLRCSGCMLVEVCLQMDVGGGGRGVDKVWRCFVGFGVAGATREASRGR
jgi:hypothetical protein